MDYKIIELNIEDMKKYARIPITFEVNSIFELALIERGLGGVSFIEQKLEKPYIKEYDDYGSGPLGWHKKFNTKNWGFFAAVNDKDEYIGGATIAFNTDNVNMLEGKKDISVLWDLRVHPDYRRQRIGKALFRAAVEWSTEKNCRQMKIETQNINADACRFYAAQGCLLGGINKHIYREESCENEVMLLWYYKL